MLRKKRKGYEKTQVVKEGVSYEPGGFQQVCFLFGAFYCTLELSEVVFFQLLSGTRNMGFLSGHQNHVTKNIRAMSSTNQILTGHTGKVEQGNQ